MFIGKVCGAVVAAQRDERVRNAKLLLIEPQVASADGSPALRPTGKNLVAVDFLGAGEGEYVLVTQGSSARLTETTKHMPVDAVIIGIVESVRLADAVLSRAGGTLES
jgi:ethanolamine utilization protein EutN